MAEALGAPVIAATDVVRTHGARGGMWRRGGGVAALRGVSVELRAGEILGLVGHSGAGKSTLARVLALLERPDAGEVRYGGVRVDHLPAAAQRPLRRGVQIVFQDPGATLDPLQRVFAAVAEPLTVHRLHEGPMRSRRVDDLLAAVGLGGDGDLLARYPRELSGGERQRVAIARALACEPRALILDEPVSALDVSVRNQVLNVLVELRARLGLAILLIAHDLALVAEVCDRVAVLLAGRVVEVGPAEDVMLRPLHPHTTFLVQATMGGVDAGSGEPPPGGQAAGVPSPCPLRGACGAATELCEVEPELRQHHDEHRVACYFPDSR